LNEKLNTNAANTTLKKFMLLISKVIY